MTLLEFRAEDLPSRGITYPEGTVFSIRGFSFGEAEDLNTASLTIESKINNFMKATTINTGLRAEDIAYIDYIYMHLGRVSSVYGTDKLKLPMICPFCGKSHTEDIAFESLDINDISEYGDIIPFKFDILGKEYTFNFLSLEKVVKWFRLIEIINLNDVFNDVQKEHAQLAKEIEKITAENPNPVLQAKWEEVHRNYNSLNGQLTSKKKAKANKYKVYGLNALLLALMCADEGTEDFDSFLDALTSEDINPEALEFLNFVENTLGVGIKPIRTTCPHCSKIFTYSLEENVNDIYPFRNTSADIANKLRTMQASKEASVPAEEGRPE